MDRPRKRILLVHNAAAGWRSARRFSAICEALEALGHDLQTEMTREAGDAGRICRTANLDAFDLVLVAGGDGTINDAVNGLSARGTQDVPPLGVLPVGTANVLAWEIGLGSSVADAVRYVEAGAVHGIRPGLVNGRAFMTMASAGFDSWVVDTVDVGLKRLIGKAAYGARALQGLNAYPRPQMTVHEPSGDHHAGTVVVTRGRCYGGRFVLAPDADLMRDSLTVCLLHDVSPAALFRAGADFLRDRLSRSANIERFEVSRVTIAGADLPVQADGDSVGRLPAEIGLAADPVRLLFPPSERESEHLPMVFG